MEERLVKALLAQFGAQVVEIFRVELTNIGLPSKYPSGVDIQLYKSVKSVVGKDFSVTIQMAPHWFWVVKGRRSRKQNPGAKPPPFAKILEWVAEKRKIQFIDKATGKFMSYNKTALLIRGAIWKNGIKGRDFVSPAVDAAQELYLNQYSEFLFDQFSIGASLDFVRPRKTLTKKTKNFKFIKVL
jgi:hypothetical protein